MEDNQQLYVYDKKDGLELKDILFRPISEYQKILQGKNHILIATVAFYILCYTKNQRFNIMQVMISYFSYSNNTTKRIIENLYCMGFLVIYKTVK